MVCHLSWCDVDNFNVYFLVKGKKVKSYHNKSINQTIIDLNASKTGLSEEEVLSRAGTKRVEKKEKKQGIAIKFLEQFADFMIIILLIASAISIVIGICERQAGEIIDGCIILAIVLMNAVFGVVQEYKAEKSLEALGKFSQAECVVIREGKRQKIWANDLVEGDLVLLEAGSIVPADLRLIETHQLKINESSLTGESGEVHKVCEEIYNENSPLGERKNMAFKGTVVSFGRGAGVVTALGEDTEFGKIATTLSDSKKQPSPLQLSIKKLGKVLTYLILVIALVTFVIEICITPSSILDAFLTSVAIAIAAIPESMPAVITIIMSMGVARLAKRKAVVKKLPAVSICSNTFTKSSTRWH